MRNRYSNTKYDVVEIEEMAPVVPIINKIVTDNVESIVFERIAC